MSLTPASNLGYNSLGKGVQADERFPDPFCDIASLSMPESIQTALRWTEYIMNANGPYRQAIDRVVSYFITDVEIYDTGDNKTGREEKEKFRVFLEDTLSIKNTLHTVAMDYMCFSGETRVPTKNGVYPIRELVGQTVDVISENGVYRPAKFKHFGRQELLEVTFADGRVVFATPEHQWLVQKSTGGTTRVPTTALQGRRIARTVAPRPEKNEDFFAGVRHGFTFGDGALYNKNNPSKQTRAVANFFGQKDAALLPYFAGVGCAPVVAKTATSGATAACALRKVHGLPARYKTLPENDATPSYWYGFICGFLAADGSVDTHGCAILTQKSRKTLEAIEAQLPRVGMVAGPIRCQTQNTLLPAYKGRRRPHSLTMHYMTLLKQFMREDDFLIPRHKENFVNKQKDTNYGKFVGVKSVRATNRVQNVYCCVEPETHSFVIDNGIITGNCYGNSFTSLLVPFRRYLSCKNCGLEMPLDKVYNSPQCAFKWQNFEFHATCPKCRASGAWNHIDRRSTDAQNMRVKRWSPHEIDILWDPYTDACSYVWKIPQDYRALIKAGHLHHLERASWEVIQAVKNEQNLMFDAGVVYHLREDALAGMRNRGWGISRILTNFRQAWYTQILHRYNEAIALDYVIPFRVITPAPRGGDSQSADPVHTINLSNFSARVQAMLRARRTDPARWNVLPFPVNYQALGGDASQLAPRDLLEQSLETLLKCIGMPVELFNGTLSLQAAPAALRLFEANWSHLPHNLNRFLNDLADTVSRALSWEPVNVKLTRVTHADDLNRQMAKLQLMQGQMISKTTGLKSVGIDYEEETKRMLDEERIYAEEQTRLQEEMAQAQQMEDLAQSGDMMAGMGQPGASATGMPPQQMPGGAAPPPQAGPPGMPGPGQPTAVDQFIMQRQNTQNIPRTPEDLQQQAQLIAQQLLSLPESLKDSELIKLKRSDQTMHALVTSIIDDIRQQARSQGGAMLMEQQFGQPSPPIM